MKKALVLATLLSTLYAVPPCENNVDVCAYQYKTPLGNELKVTNMRHVPILFSIKGGIGYYEKTIRNRLLQPYQSYSVHKKLYEKMEDNKERAHYKFAAENYNPKIKQDVKYE